MNRIEQTFADLMAAAKETAAQAPYRRPARRVAPAEPAVAMFADRARGLVQSAAKANGAWTGIRIDDPDDSVLRKLPDLDDWTWVSSYDTAVKRAARAAGLDGRLVTQFGQRKPAEGTHPAGRAYRIRIF